jgi:hypothetical protein
MWLWLLLWLWLWLRMQILLLEGRLLCWLGLLSGSLLLIALEPVIDAVYGSSHPSLSD